MTRWLVLLLLSFALAGALSAAPRPTAPPGPLLLAHYMPWFEAKPVQPRWGWHWTMNHFDPDQQAAGRRQAASHFRPLAGLYDSSDSNVLECQVLQMKLAGIDGVILDWYGPDDHLDYGVIHRNSIRMVSAVKKAGLRFAVCYEDQTVPRLISGKVIDAAQAVPHGQKVMRWLSDHWLGDPAYVRLEGRPLLLVFGPQFYTEDQWKQILAGQPNPPMFFTLHHRREPAVGAFDWPQPAPNLGLAAVDTFYQESRQWPAAIPVAFPRFHDIYKEAGVGNSLGSISDENGKTYETTLTRALQSKAAVIQLATWNDWGEGTVIEPSEEFGYRDLELTQTLRRRTIAPPLPYAASELRLPLELLRLRRMHQNEPAVQAKLNEAAQRLSQGSPVEARRLMQKVRD